MAEPAEKAPAAETSEDAMNAAWREAEKQAEAQEKTTAKEQAARLKALDGGGKKPAEKAADGTELPRGEGGKFAKRAPGAAAKPADEAEKKPENDDEAPVTVAERVAWREERRRARQEFEKQRNEFGSTVVKTRTELEQRFGPLIEAQRALERDDIDGFAKALGKGSWKDLVKERQQKIMSPEAQRIAELEQREREREERANRERQDAETRFQQQQEQRIIGQYKSELTETMTASEDQVVRVLAKNQEFCDAVFQIQREHWDGETPLTPEQAVRMKRGDAPSILDSLRASYEALHQAFGSPAAAKQEAPNGVPDRSGSSPRGKANPLPRKGAAEASPKATWDNDQEFIAEWAKRLEQSELDGDDD